MKLFSTSIILALASVGLANNTFKISVPTQAQLSKGAVHGFILVKYKKEVAEGIATNSKLKSGRQQGSSISGMQFQSRIGSSGWIMYKIPSVVDPVAFAEYVRQNEPRAINVDTVKEVHTLLLPPNDPDFDDIQFETGLSTQCGKCEGCARDVVATCGAQGAIAYLRQETAQSSHVEMLFSR